MGKVSRCNVDGCERKRHYSNGLCLMHYKRLARTGIVTRVASIDARPDELWLPVPGLEDRYEASTHGRLRWVGGIIGTTYPGKVVSGAINPDGYYQMRPYPRPDRRTVRTHQLIALAFHGACPDGLEVNHIDGDRLNNRPENLEYVLHADNIRHAWKLGNVDHRGERNGRAKLTASDVRVIRQRIAEGELQRQLAEEYGVGPSAISGVARRKSWSSLE